MMVKHSRLFTILTFMLLVITGWWMLIGEDGAAETSSVSPAEHAVAVIPETMVKDSVLKPDSISRAPATSQAAHTSTGKRILLVGDSQAEGLMHPLNAYCVSSGHTLVMAFPWYSSRVEIFAANDTLKNIVARVKPDYIIMVIGLNQIFQRNMQSTASSIAKISKVFGEIPVSWIGPVNWTDDWGINETLSQEVLPGTFFLSEHLTVPRASDNKHPNTAGYRLWMDSVAVWLNTRAKWKLQMIKPETYYVKKSITVKTLNAARLNNSVKKLQDSVNRVMPDTVKSGN